MVVVSPRPRRLPSLALPRITILGILIRIRTNSMMTPTTTLLNSHRERQRVNRGPNPSLYPYTWGLGMTNEGGQAVGGL